MWNVLDHRNDQFHVGVEVEQGQCGQMISDGHDGRNGEKDQQKGADQQCRVRDALFAALEKDALASREETGEYGVHAEENLEERI